MNNHAGSILTRPTGTCLGGRVVSGTRDHINGALDKYEEARRTLNIMRLGNWEQIQFPQFGGNVFELD